MNDRNNLATLERGIRNMAAQVGSFAWIREEWINVYLALYSEKQDVVWALDRISVWKSRLLAILPEIDATEYLFRAKLHASCEACCTNRYNDTLSYSSALLRFVKLIADEGKKKGIDSTNKAAKQLGVPEWVVTLRHDVNHSTIPPFEMLSMGIDFALRWLKRYYWDKEYERLNAVNSASDSTLISPETAIRNDIDMFCEIQLQRNPDSDNMKATVNHMYSKLKCHEALFSKILVEPGYLLPTYELLKDVLDEEEIDFLNNKSTVIPDSLLKFWSPVLKLYDTETSYYCLLHNLLASSQPHTTSLHRRLIAAWIVKIFNASKARNKKKVSLRVPSLDWSKVLTEALLSYNECSPAYLTVMLEDSSVVIPEDSKQHLMALVAIKLRKTMDALPTAIAKETMKVYTKDDLQNVKIQNDDDMLGTEDEIHWKICTDEVDWKSYPVGLLPGQKVPNIFDKEELAQEKLKNSISDDMEVSCNVKTTSPEVCFQEINTIEDSETLPTKQVLKHMIFY